jgi:hypothetical protein
VNHKLLAAVLASAAVSSFTFLDARSAKAECVVAIPGNNCITHNAPTNNNFFFDLGVASLNEAILGGLPVGSTDFASTTARFQGIFTGFDNGTTFSFTNGIYELTYSGGAVFQFVVPSPLPLAVNEPPFPSVAGLPQVIPGLAAFDPTSNFISKITLAGTFEYNPVTDFDPSTPTRFTAGYRYNNTGDLDGTFTNPAGQLLSLVNQAQGGDVTRSSVAVAPPSKVPGPLPLLGAGAAFGFSRRLRRRVQACSAIR